ncbi:MAG: spore maturation protein [Clostridia bacterium]|nr:spore maturation protein [Clostridia bacterium]
MMYISVMSVPILIAAFVGIGLYKRVGVYDCFVEGAKDGLQSMVGIIAPLIGLMVAISMFRASGAMEFLAKLLNPVLGKFNMPADVLPLAILRPVSGSASTAIVTDIFKNLGPDSTAGKIASVMMGSTETTFYTVAVYFGALGIKNTRHTIGAALIADLTGIVMSVIITRAMLL